MVISVKKYIHEYRQFEIFNRYKPRPQLLKTFPQFKRAELRLLTEDEFWRLLFFYDKENAVAMKLTEDGQKRLLRDVATKYLVETANRFTWRDNERKVNPFIKLLESRTIRQLPPIFVRQKRDDEPQAGSFFIDDGIHRLLALSAYCLKHNKRPKIKAYIGYFE